LQDGPVLPALRRMLLDPSALTAAPDRPQGRRGCLVGNTTAELVPGDDAACALAAAAYDGFIAIVTEHLTPEAPITRRIRGKQRGAPGRYIKGAGPAPEERTGPAAGARNQGLTVRVSVPVDGSA
jgi:hypothetical protein